MDVQLNEKVSIFYDRIYPGERDKANIVYEHYKKSYKRRPEVDREEEDDMDDEDYMNEDSDLDDDFDADKKQIAMAIQQNEEQYEIVKARHKFDEELNTVREEKKALLVENSKLDKKINELQKDLDITKKALKELQKQKLDKVSELYVSIFLKLDQIKNMIPSPFKTEDEPNPMMMPVTLDDSILFTEKSLRQLYNNITNLKKEQNEIEKKKQELHRERDELNQELQMLKEAWIEADNELKENYQLKFGKVIQLEILDGMEATHKLKELRKEYAKEEKESIKKVEEAKKQMLNTKQKLLELKRENTNIINKITGLGNRQLSLTKTLDSTNKQIFREEKDDKRHDVHKYRKNLKEIVKLLAKEIDDLRNEIALFKQKGGHIYALVNTTKKIEMNL